MGLILLAASCNSGQKSKKPESPEEIAKRLTEHVVDEWLRLDGGYVLDIKGFNADSTLDVAYYNPRSINVARTRWKIDGGQLFFYVLFDDEGYRGSYYSLGYFPNDDRISGYYYLAVEQQEYEVYFERKNL